VSTPSVIASLPVLEQGSRLRSNRNRVQRDAKGTIISLTWSRGNVKRLGRRVDTERREEVRFSNGDVQLVGTLTSPIGPGPHTAVILVPASGAEARDYLLPFARFLIRHGVAVLGYDKRGVGAARPATGTRRRSTTWPETSLPLSTTSGLAPTLNALR
jgi:hypothetical protein